MKICFPTQTFEGLDSTVFDHFGSAPGFVLVDTETMDIEEIQNGDAHHVHGMCQPIRALGGKQVDGIVLKGIGMGALMKLQSAGVRVYQATQETVRANLDLIKSGSLPQFSAEHTCRGHMGGGGCAHH